MDDLNATFTDLYVLPDNNIENNKLECLEELYNIKGLKIINYNIGGINKNFNLIETLLSNKNKNSQPHILNVSETWLGINSRTKLEIKGYKYIRRDRKGVKKKKGGGFLIYYAENLNIDFDVYASYMISNDDLEFLPYIVNCDHNKVLVCHVYKPPNAKIDELDYLNNFLSKIPRSMHTLVCGDLNINMVRVSANRTHLECLCLSHSLKNYKQNHPNPLQKQQQFSHRSNLY